MDAAHSVESPGGISERLERVEQELAAIKERNERVEAEKAWEVSTFRVLSITALTYLLTALVFWAIGVRFFLLNAMIPTLGYYLSTRSLPRVRRWWIKKRAKASTQE